MTKDKLFGGDEVKDSKGSSTQMLKLLRAMTRKNVEDNESELRAKIYKE